MTVSLDLVVLTLNEEKNLPYCLASIGGLVRNIYVVDSGSTDATVAIAESFGARVVTHDFVDQPSQLNWAIDNVEFESDWTMRLDGDEYLLPELKEEIGATLPTLGDDITGIYLNRRLIFMDRWIRHGTYYPTWILRIWRRGMARSEAISLNEHMLLSGGTSVYLKHDFVDHDRYGLGAWIAKHKGYARRHARFLTELKRPEKMDLPPRRDGTQAQRRRWTERNLYGRAPLFIRPVVYFLYRYFIRLGFLDGLKGSLFHLLHAFWYRFYIDVKILQMKLGRTEKSER